MLTTQIENSAPFDVFLAADAEHVDKLDHEDLLAPGSSAVYAVGVLALWIPPGSQRACRQNRRSEGQRRTRDRAGEPEAGALWRGGGGNFAARRYLGSGAVQNCLCGKHQHGETVRHLEERRRGVYRVFTGVERSRQGDPVDEACISPSSRSWAWWRVPSIATGRNRLPSSCWAAGGRAILARYGYKIH